MNKRGFTLVELLAALMVIGLMVAIAIPSSMAISRRIKQNLLTEKIKLANDGAALWAKDHSQCFVSMNSCNNVEYLSTDANTMTVTITFKELALAGYFSFDDKTKKIIENPVDKTDLSSEKITIIYDFKSKTARTETLHDYTVYQLSFNGNGSTSGSMNSVSCGNDKDCAIPVNRFRKTNYIFMGWADTENGTVKYTDRGKIKITNHKALFAIWKPAPTYVLSFNGNGSTSGEMENQTCYENQECKISPNTFQRESYLFSGWTDEKDGKTVKYNDEAKITILNNKTLYAIWGISDKIPPVITFTPNIKLGEGINVYANSVNIKIEAVDEQKIESVKFCTAQNRSCNPTINISNNSSITINGLVGDDLNNTLCAIATDASGNTSEPKCEIYKVDNESPKLTCSDNNPWSNKSSNITCRATDNVGIKKLEYRNEIKPWSSFANINIIGPFEKSINATFNTSEYKNEVKVTDVPGLVYNNSSVFAKIDKAPPLAISFDIYSTVNNPAYNVTSIVCSNNEMLASGDENPNYNMYANNECTVNTKKIIKEPEDDGELEEEREEEYVDVKWNIEWIWTDDWTQETGYSSVSHITFTGCDNSSYYTGGPFPACFKAKSGETLTIYTVDKAGNKSNYYLKFTIN